MDMARKKETGERSESVEALANPLIGDGWGEVVGRIPVDLEATARAAGLMVRNREVRSASDLLRIVLAYALCDWSLRVVGVWSHLIGLGELSDVAVLKRVRSCQVWLGQIVLGCLLARRVEFAEVGVRLRLIDATCVSRPGSRGTDWRVHLSLDLGPRRSMGSRLPMRKEERRWYATRLELGTSRLGIGGMVIVAAWGWQCRVEPGW